MHNESRRHGIGDSAVVRPAGMPRCSLQGLVLSLVLVGNPVWSQVCDVQPSQASMVLANFQRVLKEGDFASAQDYAERSQRGLDQLANQARRCGCEPARTGFESAAAEMRTARFADSRKALHAVVERATVTFDRAMAEQRRCAGG